MTLKYADIDAKEQIEGLIAECKRLDASRSFWLQRCDTLSATVRRRVEDVERLKQLSDSRQKALERCVEDLREAREDRDANFREVGSLKVRIGQLEAQLQMVVQRPKGHVAETLTAVLAAIHCQKGAIVDHLFGDAPKYYQEEWYHRNEAEFWAHLDESNRVRLVHWVVTQNA